MPNIKTVGSPIIIIGPGRSGSSWMLKMLGQHPLIQALPENGLVAALYKEMHNSWWSDTMLHLHCKSDANLRTERAVDAVRSLLCAIFPAEKPYWVMKIIWGYSSIWGLSLDFLQRAFPEARYVHMVRSPVTSLPSMLEYLGNRGLFKTAQSAERVYIDAHKESLSIRDAGLPYLKVHQERIQREPEKVWNEVLEFAELPAMDLETTALNEEVVAAQSMQGKVKAGRTGIDWAELSSETFELCRELGYRPPDGVTGKPSPPQRETPKENELMQQMERLATERSFYEARARALTNELRAVTEIIRQSSSWLHSLESRFDLIKFQSKAR